jgi:hypothetical protein
VELFQDSVLGIGGCSATGAQWIDVSDLMTGLQERCELSGVVCIMTGRVWIVCMGSAEQDYAIGHSQKCDVRDCLERGYS